MYNGTIENAATELINHDKHMMSEVKDKIQRPVPPKKLDDVDLRKLELQQMRA